MDQPALQLNLVRKSVGKLGTTLGALERELSKSERDDRKIRLLADALESGLKEIPVTEVLSWVETLRQWLSVEEKEREVRFAGEIGSAFTNMGLPLRGQLPELSSGQFTIKVERNRETVEVLFGPEPVGRCARRAEAIAREVGRCRAVVCAQRFEGPRLFETIAKAYKRALGSASGGKVPLTEVHREMVFVIQSRAFHHNPTKANFKEYSRAMFGYDLYLLRHQGTAGSLRVTLSPVTLDASVDKRNFIWVPDGDGPEGTRYSSIVVEGA